MRGEQAGPMSMGETVPFTQLALPNGESSPLAFLQPASQPAGNHQLGSSTSAPVPVSQGRFVNRQTASLAGSLSRRQADAT